MKSTLLFDLQKTSYYCQELSFPGPEHTVLHVRVWMPSHIESIEAASAVVLAVHGIYQSSHSFDFQALLAMEGTVFIAVDLPFHGETVTPDGLELSADLMADSVRSVIDYLSLDEVNLFLMGWSFGGWVLGCYLQKYGVDGVRGLVLVSSLFGDIAQSFAYIKDENYSSLETIKMLSDPSVAVQRVFLAVSQFVGMLKFRKDEEDETVEEVSLALGYNLRAVMRMRGLFAPMAIVAQSPVSEGVYQMLKSASLPVFMMTGKQDALLPLGWFRAMASELSHVEMHEIDNCGHSCFAEYPEKFNALVLNFVQSHLV